MERLRHQSLRNGSATPVSHGGFLGIYRNMTLLIRTTSLTGYRALVTRLGGDADTLLRRFNIEPEQVKKLEGVLPFHSVTNLIEETARQLDCPDFGLRLAQQQDLMILGPLAAMAKNAPTVKESMQSTIDCLHYYTRGLRIGLDSRGDGGYVCLWFETSEGPPLPRQSAELTLCVAHRALTMLCGESLPPVVWLKSDGPLHDSYREYFDVPIVFSQQRDALLLSPELLEKKIERNDPQLHQFLCDYISDALLDEPLDLKRQVEQLIHRLMPIQRCNLQEVANQLGLHKRTLQRRLSESSIIFEKLLDDIRRKQAEDYLSEADMPMTRIAILLGYREQSSFNRACRRWFGTTPMKVRRRLQGAAVSP